MKKIRIIATNSNGTVLSNVCFEQRLFDDGRTDVIKTCLKRMSFELNKKSIEKRDKLSKKRLLEL